MSTGDGVTRDQIAEALWGSIDNEGIKGLLFSEDCLYLADVVLQNFTVLHSKDASEEQVGDETFISEHYFATYADTCWVCGDPPHPESLRDYPLIHAYKSTIETIKNMGGRDG